ncbi:hypothetical protein JCM16775_0785 [Leptotrichia hofstadii]|uniref:Uncharacterized protein n=1 Tax=Leptotrichia hofstadii TaxID=157688 RepID=A0A510JFN6_9FUSO|nr:hypothetical protein [Leptotrichia hofstadii]BBM38078.1 hypothetical protein JCM16775_0785 [Leptotrichia hofstadii]
MIKEFKYYSETYLSENDIITKIDSEKGKFEIKKSTDNKWEINYHDLNSELFSSVDFSKYIYNEIKNKYFYPMIVEYKNKIINIENKKNILKELNNATFEYFKKIPQKIKETNHVLKTLKKGLELENLEYEIKESVLYYLFKFDDIKNNQPAKEESETFEIYDGWQIPTFIEYKVEEIENYRKKIYFNESINENKVSRNEIISMFREYLSIPIYEMFEFNFLISGFYILNLNEEIEKIEVNKEIKFYNIITSSKRVLELKKFDENIKNDGRTYDEAVGELFEYLDKMKHKKKINRQEFENFVDEIAFSEKPKIFKTLKWYIETNKIGFLEFLEGERDRIYISEKDILNTLGELFEYSNLKRLSEETNKVDKVKETSKLEFENEEKKLPRKVTENHNDNIYNWLFFLLKKDNNSIFPKKEFLEKIKFLDGFERMRTFNVIKSAVEHDGYCVKFEEGKTIEGYEVKKIFGEMLGIDVEEEVVEKVEKKEVETEEEKKLTPQQLRKKYFLKRMKGGDK